MMLYQLAKWIEVRDRIQALMEQAGEDVDLCSYTLEQLDDQMFSRALLWLKPQIKNEETYKKVQIVIQQVVKDTSTKLAYSELSM